MRLSALALGILLAGFASGATHAAPADSCLLVAEPATGRVLADEGDCSTQRSPASTFKVALALMGFDAGILKGAETPLWDRPEDAPEGLATWAGPQTPESWMQRSVVWFSQRLTRALGAERLADYVRAFAYGNIDLVGDPGRNNGLSRAWLSSSLRISPQEQVGFLTRMLEGRLPVSAAAVAQTRSLMALDESPDGWRLYGKTGSGRLRATDGGAERQFGWFVGFAQKDDRSVVFARFISTEGAIDEPASFIARREAIAALARLLPAAPSQAAR